MPEGLLVAGAVTGAVHDDPDRQPPPGPDARRGWTWDRKGKKWSPRQRGPIIWKEDSDAGPDQDAGERGGRGADDAAADSGHQADPEPSWLGDDDEGGKPPGDGKLKFDDVPKQVKDDIAGFAGLIGTPLLAMLQQADPYCGTILAQSFENVIDATLPLICRSSRIVKYFSQDDTDWLLWGKLAMALKPFAQAVIQHHILRTVDVGRDEHGQVYVIKRSQDEHLHGDHLTPPGPDYRYAA